MFLCVCVFFFYRVHFKHFGCIFEIYHIVDSLSAWSGIIIVCTIYFHSGFTFCCYLHFWKHMGLCFWCVNNHQNRKLFTWTFSLQLLQNLFSKVLGIFLLFCITILKCYSNIVKTFHTKNLSPPWLDPTWKIDQQDRLQKCLWITPTKIIP